MKTQGSGISPQQLVVGTPLSTATTHAKGATVRGVIAATVALVLLLLVAGDRVEAQLREEPLAMLRPTWQTPGCHKLGK